MNTAFHIAIVGSILKSLMNGLIRVAIGFQIFHDPVREFGKIIVKFAEIKDVVISFFRKGAKTLQKHLKAIGIEKTIN